MSTPPTATGKDDRQEEGSAPVLAQSEEKLEGIVSALAPAGARLS